MADAELIVHRLRLAVPPAGAPGLAARVDDALRCATRPPALRHRHVLVRRLRLRLPAAASSASIALQLEQAWQRIAVLARPLDDATEADEAVWASGEAAARAALALRWARGLPAEAWFWQRIARPVGPAVDAWPLRALRLAVAPLDEAPGPPAGWPSGTAAAAPALRPVLQALAAAGLLHRFVAGLAAGERAQLAALIADQAPLAAAAAAADSAGPPAPALHGVLAATWRALQRLQGQFAEDAAASAVRPAPSALPTRRDDPVALLQAPAAAPAAGAGSTRRAEAPGRSSPPSRPADPVAVPASSTDDIAPGSAPAMPPDGVCTAWAGLWLLLPILLRCGLADADAPGPAFAQALRAAPGCLHLPADDPVLGLIDALDLPPAPGPGPWLRQARLAALHEARLPLRRIARRRGQVLLSDSRLDIVFPPEAADVRLRRAGFDLDPGFVPWLGRIVRFHYLVP